MKELMKRAMDSLDLSYRCVSLLDIATVERAAKRIYSAGNIIIQVSAAKRMNIGSPFILLTDDTMLESKYAVISPKTDIEPEYLAAVLELAEPQWHHKYVGDNINIQMEAFKDLELNYHTNPDTRKFILAQQKALQHEIDAVEKQIAADKRLKEYMLNKLFI